jgi:hypothetical protein
MRPNYYDRSGQPIYDVLEWDRKCEDIDSRRVGLDEVVCGDEQVRVSTVFLGLDHQWGDGPPLIFETMVFGSAVDQWQCRYSTEEQAREGHAAAVAALRRADLQWFEEST